MEADPLYETFWEGRMSNKAERTTKETSEEALQELADFVVGGDRVYGMIYVSTKAVCLAIEEAAAKIAKAIEAS